MTAAKKKKTAKAWPVAFPTIRANAATSLRILRELVDRNAELPDETRVRISVVDAPPRVLSSVTFVFNQPVTVADGARGTIRGYVRGIELEATEWAAFVALARLTMPSGHVDARAVARDEAKAIAAGIETLELLGFAQRGSTNAITAYGRDRALELLPKDALCTMKEGRAVAGKAFVR